MIWVLMWMHVECPSWILNMAMACTTTQKERKRWKTDRGWTSARAIEEIRSVERSIARAGGLERNVTRKYTEYWALRLSAWSFARTAHSAMLTLASTSLPRSFVCSLAYSLPARWDLGLWLWMECVDFQRFNVIVGYWFEEARLSMNSWKLAIFSLVSSTRPSLRSKWLFVFFPPAAITA